MDRIRIALIVVVVALTAVLATWTYAQAPAPTIISGADVGFRVDQQRTRELGKLTGSWVVRLNGQWVEPQLALRSSPLSTR